MHIPFLDIEKITQKYQPHLSEAIVATINSGWYLNGKNVKEFENSFAQYIGTSYCISVGNGLDALTLALTAMKQLENWNDGDEVIVPAFTFIATAEAVNRSGLTPIFIDIDNNFTLDLRNCEQLITSKTWAIIPVHLYGKPCNMRILKKIANNYGLKILEDAAQAHGAQFENKRIGSWGDAAAFSFYPGKNLGALGDGGAVTTNNEKLAKHIQILANYGAENKYYHTYQGCNSRLDEIQAAVLSIKLTQLDYDNKRRQEIAQIYATHINNTAAGNIPYTRDTTQSVFHIYPFMSPTREKLQSYLARHDIETLIHYPLALHKQIVYNKSYGYLSFPYAERAAKEELSLPISPVMTNDEALYITEIINKFIP